MADFGFDIEQPQMDPFRIADKTMRKIRTRRSVKTVFAFAGAAACILGGLLFIRTPQSQEVPQPGTLIAESASQTFTVPSGADATLRLPDGTTITVNSNTTIVYPDAFNGEERRIFVDGEAYMDVAKDEHKPFFVDTPRFSVKVHGTKFNVNTYNPAQTSVILEEGSVELIEKSAERSTMMTPGQMAVLTDGGLQIERVDLQSMLSWKDGFIYMKGMSLHEVAERLENYYGVEVKCMSDKQMYGKLDLRRPIEEVMQNINTIIPINIRKEGPSFTITTQN